ncbi:MAG: beta-N-acetylhexosaminidase [Crocinitomicaceae bacterium]|nr:beta-N-acetylhexosaminidase [Crocinitomicaceae bacterium]
MNYKLLFHFLLISTLFFLSCNHDNDEHAEFDCISADSVAIIPAPLHLETRDGNFKLDQNTFISYASDLEMEANYFKGLIDSASTFSIQRNVDAQTKSSEIELKIVFDFPEELQDEEAYRIIIAPQRLQITALQPQGIMHGIQTVRQLFVNSFHSGEKRNAWYLPCLKIEDKPAFHHRGLLLDVCRHFFEKKVIFKYLDVMSYYKMNVLHFHLTEDQGWRIPIEKYPLLNQISSFRKEKDGTMYGGFYTKDDLKEIVAYANERHIEVIPEIELPGHSQAAIAAYPHLSCTGQQIEVANEWGVFKDIYCAGNDSVFIFLEDVLTEVMEIFPSKYIHIGGDEAPKYQWEHCKKCQQRMKDEGLLDEHELQSYFIQRIENFLNENGRMIIGWDEILEGGLSPNATVQSWRGFDGGINAAQQNHPVIMSPTSHCYLDYGLDAIDLKKIYSFNPIPLELKKEFQSFILGAECNMWTEQVPDENNLDSKVFPRMIALAEVLWSGPDTNRYDDFYKRLQLHYPILDYFKIHYGMESVPFEIRTKDSAGTAYVELYNLQSELTVQWRFFELEDTNWIEYHEPVELTMTGSFGFQAYKRGKKYGDIIHAHVAMHDAVFQTAVYQTKWNNWYSANENVALVDGKLGSHQFRDGNWQGFWGDDAVLTIYFNAQKTVSSVTMNFLEYSNAWIMRPKKITILLSEDGKSFHAPNGLTEIPVNAAVVNDVSINPFRLQFDEIKIMAMKIHVENYGILPASHPAAGQEAWLFLDEIIVE